MLDFDLPITYLKNKSKIDDHLVVDLELSLNKDDNAQEYKSAYQNIFKKDESYYSNEIIPLWSKYYTSDKEYIKNTQKLLRGDIPDTCPNKLKMEEIISDIKAETGFYSKYEYLDNSWTISKMLNNQPMFLQMLCMYNITSPVFSLILPIFFLILPFFIIKIQGYSISISKYIKVLSLVLKRHQLGKIFTIAESNWNQRIYILVSLAFYLFQTYQNILSCMSFYKNSKLIHSHLSDTRDYITSSLESMESLNKRCLKLKSYNGFIENMNKHYAVLKNFKSSLDNIKCYKFTISRTFSMGNVMCCFNKLYNDTSIINSLDYTLYLEAYFKNLKDIQSQLSNKNMNLCKVTNKHTKFKEAYFPPKNDSTVNNSYKLNKNILITGPNAAGKTTILKSTIFNILLSQQIGCGFYSSAKINPYDYIHSYLNIPDTSGRDSLFQAEARRCVDIINHVENNTEQNDSDQNNTEQNNITRKKLRHFCVFDELYSGTNPYEAIGSAVSFLEYLKKYKNVTFMITTHFLEVCKRLNKEKGFINSHMNVDVNNDDFNYTYKLKKGISSIKGGVKVLHDLHYPQEIVENTKKIINNLNI